MSLKKKRSKLEEQISESQNLESNTHRRGVTVRKILTKYLDEEEMEVFEKYTRVMIQKITEMKEMDQKVQQGEEQLVALNQHQAANSNSTTALRTLSEEEKEN